ncbi:MAG: MBOAT family O-acyltransferase [Bacteroidota bacterium]|nr:MBOAT family O-acyltransferase [Bacteroidota bacterium]MDP3146175.1 MBOAT family O-acyltransferase [Bacteroidota bacterium]MDP3556672.1 MBOAT family O-acyltransferase [Bacteroidota bacterium]
MLFNSFEFLVFFVVVTGLYFILPHKLRWLMLLIASCTFYMFFIPVYILILAGTIVIDYFAGIYIEKSQGKKRRFLLIISLISNIGILAFFKYYNFFIDNFNTLFNVLDWNYSLNLLKIILPIGLSFHTFQAMSYTIEVYRGNQKAEKHFGIYALYVMYYPQLVAGPIERPQNLLPQFHTAHKYNSSLVSNGLKQMLIGFFKKIVIADNLAVYVNQVYDNPTNYESVTIFVATVCFAFQIYCDFSGYSDIAIGASRIMGIELMQNFKAPYRAISISDFWARWHMSLSTWFKDYLYIPLGGNRVGFYRLCFNLFIVFVVSGFWHGASWTFIVWGALHGLFTVIEIVLNKYIKFNERSGNQNHLKLIFKRALVFYVVCFAWIFFRAENISLAIYIAKKYLLGIPSYIYNLSQSGYLWLEPLIFEKNIKEYYSEFFLLGSAILILFFINKIEYKTKFITYLDDKKFIYRLVFYHALAFLILFIGAYHSEQEFIYFQF